ncbi:zinc ribbon domain-containing protein [Actinocrinis puniceicyclus]|uniref:zinc ribbon domain-containing protein n=1 Tax=Actinocrinis puniceicyclus TaxID=977794 RepID=UPI003F68A657
MQAAPADQQRLLDLQALDSKLDQLAHRRRTLPQLSEHTALETRAGQLRDLLVAATTAQSDLAREQRKAEADVDQVRSRAERDRKLLESGSAGARELSNLQSELESLAKRQSALEDVVLDVMERVESASARTAELTRQRDLAEADLTRVTAALSAEQASVDKDVAFARSQRGLLVAQLPADLLALYEKLRAQYGGIGAAAIKQRRCEGCRLELDISEVNEIRAAAPDAVLRHDSCRRILVRTADSGL